MFISLFNIADAYKNGRLYAFSFKAFDADISESIGSGFPQKISRESSELVYDAAPAGGRGGQEDDPFLDDEAYPTTEDDALATRFQRLPTSLAYRPTRFCGPIACRRLIISKPDSAWKFCRPMASNTR